MGAKLFWFPAFGLLALLLLGVALTGGAKTHAAAVEAETAAMSSGTEAGAGVLAPQTTPTPYFPDYLPALSWNASYPCPAPVLDVHTIITGHATCQRTIMHLENSAGDSRDFVVPNEAFGGSTSQCQVGPCIPYSWLTSMPFTLTVDYGNGVQESNETNNVLVWSTPPPQATACQTVTATPTSLPSSTPTATHTPSFPDLVGNTQWVADCPVAVLEMRTQLLGDACAVAGTSHMRLQNSIGEHMDFAVSSLGTIYPVFAYDCPVGTCLPPSWLQHMPFTLTVDVLNEVWELNGEGNNVSTFNTPPPPCGSVTTTPTWSPTPAITATPSCPPGTPDLTAYAYWTSECAVNGGVLHIYTRLSGDSAPATTMHLNNNTGYQMDFPVPPLTNNGEYTTDVNWNQVGYPPLTLTVDYYNVVQECNETNNTFAITYIPPTTTPCATATFTGSPVTGTPTRTPSPTITPTNTGTPTTFTECLDLVGSLQWVGTCPAPVLRLTSFLHYPIPVTAGPSHMRLQNSMGDYVDFPVPAYGPGNYSYQYDCVVGNCIPASWLQHLPFTLTVDVLNEVQECDETNNTYTFYLPPPVPTPCNVTPTATPPNGGTATPSATACPMTFTDVLPTDYFYRDVQFLYCRGAISGYADNTFRPYNNTTRGQITKIVVVAFALPIDTTGGPHFSDVPEGSAFYIYVETAYNRHIITGYADGTFRPGNNVTRGQLVKIVCLAAGWTAINPPLPSFTDVPVGSAFYAYVETAYCHAIITGYADGTFRPGNNATRGQVAKIVAQAVLGGNIPCAPSPTPAAP